MKNSSLPIGVFDSGVGGLTVVKEIIKQMPFESIVYFGDTARLPYGSKSKEVVKKFSFQILNFLLSKKVKMIVVACNTVSSYALEDLKQKTNLPVIGVIDPVAKKSISLTKNGIIGVIGTEGTIKSKAYENSIKKLEKNIKVFSVACPLFVPLVEEGWIDGSSKEDIVEDIAKEYLLILRKKNIDTL
ncbi:MAG: glutamate racemase, partial [Endomicrobiia bacterium]